MIAAAGTVSGPVLAALVTAFAAIIPGVLGLVIGIIHMIEHKPGPVSYQPSAHVTDTTAAVSSAIAGAVTEISKALAANQPPPTTPAATDPGAAAVNSAPGGGAGPFPFPNT
jgi:hypothetical protein